MLDAERGVEGDEVGWGCYRNRNPLNRRLRGSLRNNHYRRDDTRRRSAAFFGLHVVLQSLGLAIYFSRGLVSLVMTAAVR